MSSAMEKAVAAAERLSGGDAELAARIRAEFARILTELEADMTRVGEQAVELGIQVGFAGVKAALSSLPETMLLTSPQVLEIVDGIDERRSKK